MQDERERALRRRFGPPPGDGRAASAPPSHRRLDGRLPRPPRGVITSVVVLAALTGLAGAGLALTPHDHVAPGCFWWTARTVGQVVAGQAGCLRGVFTEGGALAESEDPGSPSLAMDPGVRAGPGGSECRFRPADAMVVRYHAVFDDGRTIVVVDRCA